MSKAIVLWVIGLAAFVFGCYQLTHGVDVFAELLAHPQLNFSHLFWAFLVYILFAIVKIALGYVLYRLGRESYRDHRPSKLTNTTASYKDIVNVKF